MSYADLPASFRSTVETVAPSTTWSSGSPDPWAVARMLHTTRASVIAQVAKDVELSLLALAPLKRTYQHTPTPLVTTIELSEVTAAPKAGAARQGSISHPGFSGYSPAGVFGKLVKKALRKAKQKQTHGLAAAGRVQVVYIEGNQIAHDLNHPAHRKAAAAHLQAVEPLAFGLDAIAFVARVAGSHDLASVFTVVDDTNITIENVKALFHHRD